MNILMITLAFIFAMFPPKVKNFSGLWELDAKKSKNLPKSFEQVESYTMDVRQTPDSMFLNIGLKGGSQNVTFPLTVYLLNGKEVFREDTLRLSKRWMTCSWASNGSALVVSTRVELGSGDKKKEFTQRDEWRLKDASTFEISLTQKFANSDSTHSELRVFHKKK
jgi:hypothetical protein